MEIPRKLRIALDVMGGDYAPEREIAGAKKALSASNGEFEIVLVGNDKTIHHELASQKIDKNHFPIVHASQVITMEDVPTVALKHKKESSLSVGMRLHKEGKVDAVVSAGNTGAVLTAATLILGRIKGISRPTIGTFIPAEHGKCLLLDAGANVDSRARHLYEFAQMGSVFYKLIWKKENPTVALLNVGEEHTKGTEEVLGAYKLLSDSKLNFIGNIEGGDILKAKADVVICDGFIGNIVLKFGESMPRFLKNRLKKFSSKGIIHKLAVALSRWPLKSSLKDLDPNEEGGVPVLGVEGVVIIGHGNSTPKGIKNMILRAVEMARSQINRQIELALN